MGAKSFPSVVHYAIEAGAVELREMPVPEIGDEDVLLAVGAVGVCGSDIHQAHNTHSWPVNIPVILGHEFAGTIAAVGRSVSGFAEGDRVVSETAAHICGRCALCRAGRYNLCPQRKGFGYGTDGAMSSYVRVPARCLHHLPDSLSFEAASLTEPCCVAYHAVAVNSRVRPGDAVVVLGPGPIGTLCACMASLCGADPVIVCGLSTDETRFQSALELGATRIVNIEKEDPIEAARSTGDGLGVDLVVDATGASAPLKGAMEMVRPDGRITKVGWGPQPLEYSIDPIVQKNVAVQGSFSHTYVMWEKVIHLLHAGRIPAEKIIGRRLPIDRWRDGFEAMHSGQVLKSVLIPEPVAG